MKNVLWALRLDLIDIYVTVNYSVNFQPLFHLFIYLFIFIINLFSMLVFFVSLYFYFDTNVLCKDKISSLRCVGCWPSKPNTINM